MKENILETPRATREPAVGVSSSLSQGAGDSWRPSAA